MTFRKTLVLIVMLLALSAAGCEPTIAYGRLDVQPLDVQPADVQPADAATDDVAHASRVEVADADL